jgi:hypothetical protein
VITGILEIIYRRLYAKKRNTRKLRIRKYGFRPCKSKGKSSIPEGINAFQ